MDTLHLWQRYVGPFLQGLLTTVELTALGLVVAVGIGALVAAGRMSRFVLVRGIAVGYVDVMRATPTLIVLFLTYYGLGEIGVLIPAFWAGVFGLGVFYAALFAEIFRGGIESVARGQTEAADALAMGPWLRLRTVILPQAFGAILLPSTNTIADFIKDTSLVVVIGVADLTSAAQSGSSDTYRPMDMYVLAALMYFVLYLVISRLLARWELNVQRSRH